MANEHDYRNIITNPHEGPFFPKMGQQYVGGHLIEAVQKFKSGTRKLYDSVRADIEKFCPVPVTNVAITRDGPVYTGVIDSNASPVLFAWSSTGFKMKPVVGSGQLSSAWNLFRELWDTEERLSLAIERDRASLEQSNINASFGKSEMLMKGKLDLKAAKAAKEAGLTAEHEYHKPAGATKKTPALKGRISHAQPIVAPKSVLTSFGHFVGGIAAHIRHKAYVRVNKTSGKISHIAARGMPPADAVPTPKVFKMPAMPKSQRQASSLALTFQEVNPFKGQEDTDPAEVMDICIKQKPKNAQGLFNLVNDYVEGTYDHDSEDSLDDHVSGLYDYLWKNGAVSGTGKLPPAPTTDEFGEAFPDFTYLSDKDEGFALLAKLLPGYKDFEGKSHVFVLAQSNLEAPGTKQHEIIQEVLAQGGSTITLRDLFRKFKRAIEKSDVSEHIEGGLPPGWYKDPVKKEFVYGWAGQLFEKYVTSGQISVQDTYGGHHQATQPGTKIENKLNVSKVALPHEEVAVHAGACPFGGSTQCKKHGGDGALFHEKGYVHPIPVTGGKEVDNLAEFHDRVKEVVAKHVGGSTHLSDAAAETILRDCGGHAMLNIDKSLIMNWRKDSFSCGGKQMFAALDILGVIKEYNTHAFAKLKNSEGCTFASDTHSLVQWALVRYEITQAVLKNRHPDGFIHLSRGTSQKDIREELEKHKEDDVNTYVTVTNNPLTSWADPGKVNTYFDGDCLIDKMMPNTNVFISHWAGVSAYNSEAETICISPNSQLTVRKNDIYFGRHAKEQNEAKNYPTDKNSNPYSPYIAIGSTKWHNADTEKSMSKQRHVIDLTHIDIDANGGEDWLRDARKRREAGERRKGTLGKGFTVEQLIDPSRLVKGVEKKWLSAGGVVVNNEGKIALIKPLNEHGGYKWTFPKGQVEPGESRESCAQREVLEESGLKGNVIGDLGIHEGTMSRTNYFLMQMTEDTGHHDGETEQVVFVTPKEAKKMLHSGRDLRVLELANKKLAELDSKDHKKPYGHVAYKRTNKKSGKISLISAKGMKPTPESPKTFTANPGRPAGGSQGGKWFTDQSGEHYFGKHYAGNTDRLGCEHLANQIYNLFGISAPETAITSHGDKPTMMSKEIKGEIAGNKNRLINSDLHEGFVADAWLGNYDVTGLEYDNVIVSNTGTAHRIDNGASFVWRAMGKKKEFGEAVKEIDSMRDPQYPAGRVFEKLSDADVAQQILSFASKYKERKEKLDDVINSAPISPPLKDHIRHALHKRANWLIKEGYQLMATRAKAAGIVKSTRNLGKVTDLKKATKKHKKGCPATKGMGLMCTCGAFGKALPKGKTPTVAPVKKAPAATTASSKKAGAGGKTRYNYPSEKGKPKANGGAPRAKQEGLKPGQTKPQTPGQPGADDHQDQNPVKVPDQQTQFVNPAEIAGQLQVPVETLKRIAKKFTEDPKMKGRKGFIQFMGMQLKDFVKKHKLTEDYFGLLFDALTGKSAQPQQPQA